MITEAKKYKGDVNALILEKMGRGENLSELLLWDTAKEVEDRVITVVSRMTNELVKADLNTNELFMQSWKDENVWLEIY